MLAARRVRFFGMLKIIMAEAHNIFARAQDGGEQLHLRDQVRRADIREGLDFAQAATGGFLDNRPRGLHALCAVLDQVKHVFIGRKGERAGRQVNIDDLVALHNAQARVRQVRRRKCSKFHKYGVLLCCEAA